MAWQGNRYTRFNAARKNHPHEPINIARKNPYTVKQLKAAEAAGRPIDVSQYEPNPVMKLPGIHRKRNTIARSDKGKKHRKRYKAGSKEAPVDAITPHGGLRRIGRPLFKNMLDQCRHTKETADYIKKCEEKEIESIEHAKNMAQLQERRKEPRRVAIRKAREKEMRDRRKGRVNAERNKLRRENGRADVAKAKEKRLAAIPSDHICTLCNTEKVASKCWRVMLFADGLHSICRACYDAIRTKYFGGDVKCTLAFIKCCKYEDLTKEIGAK